MHPHRSRPLYVALTLIVLACTLGCSWIAFSMCARALRNWTSPDGDRSDLGFAALMGIIGFCQFGAAVWTLIEVAQP